MADVGAVTVEDDGNLFQSLALGLDEPTVGDGTLDDQNDHVDKVVLPASLLQADGLRYGLAMIIFRSDEAAHIDILIDKDGAFGRKDVGRHALGADGKG